MLELKSKTIIMHLNEDTGVIEELRSAEFDWQINGEKCELFHMNVILPNYPMNTVLSSNQSVSFIEKTERSVKLVYRSLKVLGVGCLNIGFTASIYIEEDGFRFEGTLENHSPYMVEHVAYPYFASVEPPQGCARFDRMIWGYGQMKVDELYPAFHGEIGYWSSEFPFKRIQNAISPFVLMQGEDGRGLYVGCHDTGIPYDLEYFQQVRPAVSDSLQEHWDTPQDDGTILPWMEFLPVHLIFCVPGEDVRLMPVVAAAYEGGWEKGTDIYRHWHDKTVKPAKAPEWLKYPQAWYQIQMLNYGGGFQKRFNDIPDMARKCKAHGISCIQLTGWTVEGQDGCLPVCDPDPRLGSWEELKTAIAESEEMGVHIVLYTKYNFADMRTEWFRNELHNYASCDAYGEIHSFSGYPYERFAIRSGANTHRLAIMCQHSVQWQNICLDILQKCIDLGASGILVDETQHHHTMYICFSKSHGHIRPAHTFAGDLILGQRMQKLLSDKGKEEFLLGGEACLDFQSITYQLGYFRVGGESFTSDCLPVQRYIAPNYAYLCGVWGFNDRNSLNICLLYRYIISYETRQFRGDVDEFPQTLSYGKMIDSLRLRYAQRLWYADFVTTCDTSVQACTEVRHAVYCSHDGAKRSVVLANFGDDPAVAHIGWQGKLLVVTPEAPDEVFCTGEVMLLARSAAVVMEV
ncbi:MAG: DUF6259 domain-containing protein [Candidatus Excrementavichristensenella sp.]|jgi:hypothetical protein